ncbi:hypothetical protein [Cryobacterium lyxosi]|uniref:ABC transporter permease n=1 Tax=Cryobacterium lyxosi TaxID=1259228 RepID=A0A4R8ZK51_9MICO|nr:hypothetical protein [Cryobacterium lyxosi]TFD28545.1 hypothetical protein E3T27_01140 [Cryobacterium lyxosi]
MIRGLIASAVVGIASGALSILLLSSIADAADSQGVSVTGSLEVAAITTALSVSLCICTAVGRDISSGFLETMAVLVPSRRRHLLARWLGVSAVVAMTALAATVVTSVLIFARAGFSAEVLAVVVASLIVVPLCTVLFGSLAFFIATLTRRPLLSVLVLVGLYIVFPLAAAFLQAPLPVALTPAINWLVETSPTLLFLKAVGVSAVEDGGIWPISSGALGLLAWVGTSAVLASYATFHRER